VRAAFERHVAVAYIQHNPNIADGRDAAISALEPIHVHARSGPDERGGAVADLYRIADGLIVEHWDVLQSIPEATANDHPMF
jgi:predicted SnoaL-like aldol condensation-catalyzing enzyme